jgi:subtilisin family serine protease
MRLVVPLVLILLLGTPLVAYPQSPTADTKAPPAPVVPGAAVSSRRVIVKLRTPLTSLDPQAKNSLDQLSQSLDLTLTSLFYPAPRKADALARFQALDMDRFYLATAVQDIDTKVVADSYKASTAVEDAWPDAIGEGSGALSQAGMGRAVGPPDSSFILHPSSLPNDPGYAQQWHLPKINALGAWDISTGDPTMVVAIIDTGLWGWHPDLRYRVWYNPGEVAGNGRDDDDNGYTDDNWGWDYVNSDNVPQGDHWHGSHVGGIVGAEVNNGIGVAGLDQQARLMAVKVLDSQNQGNYSDFAQGMYYAVQNGARVLNLSLGGTANDAALRAMVDYAHGEGALVVVCMMNANTATPYYPAAFPNALAVGATDQNDYRASPFHWGGGSNYGGHIDVVAPGNLLYSTQINDEYLSQSGTSMASPLVAALGALVWSVAPRLTNTEVVQVIRQTAVDGVGRANEDTSGWDQYMGFGRIDAARAVARARDLATQQPTPRVTVTPAAPTATWTAGTPATRTATATATPAIERTAPPPTATPGPGCTPLLVNGGFDGRDGWTLSGRRALISGTGHTGTGLFLGLQAGDSVENPDGDWASALQDVVLPASLTGLTLDFWAFTGHTGGADAGDRFIARVLDSGRNTLVDIPLHVDSGAWVRYEVDLTGVVTQAGQTVSIYFGVKNVAGQGGNAYLRVDDAALVGCASLEAAATPTMTPTATLPAPTASPSITTTPPLPTPTATPYPRGPFALYLPALAK